MSEELVKDALEFILDKNNMPCLVMDQYVHLVNWGARMRAVVTSSALSACPAPLIHSS